MADLDIKTATSSATSKSTPVDADRLNLFDSASSWAFKALTWANLKATLKTYFDTLYTGDQDLSGYAPLQCYETIYIDAGAMVPTTTNGAATGTNEYETNDIMADYMAFDATTPEKVQFKMIMPEKWNLGTVKAKFEWTSATGSTTADTVEWGIKAGAISDGDAIDAALGTGVVVSDALLADAGADGQLTGATGAMTVGGTPALGDLVVFEAYRNVSGTDDMVEDAWLLGVWIQYKTLTTAPAAW